MAAAPFPLKSTRPSSNATRISIRGMLCGKLPRSLPSGHLPRHLNKLNRSTNPPWRRRRPPPYPRYIRHGPSTTKLVGVTHHPSCAYLRCTTGRQKPKWIIRYGTGVGWSQTTTIDRPDAVAESPRALTSVPNGESTASGRRLLL